MPDRIVVLCGGVGAARFLTGVVRVVDPARVTAIVNVADDAQFHGLHVSPDLDTVLYTLAGVVDGTQGWGIADDTHAVQAALARLGRDTWFQLGDADLATHIHRTALLREGVPLSEVTARLARAFGVATRLLPASDEPQATMVRTDDGWFAFQDYFVRRRQRDTVREVRFDGAGSAGPGVCEAIAEAVAVVIAPSNPIVSIGPILALRGLREALASTAAPVVAVSPIIGGDAVKGPAAAMLASLGHEVSAVGVAR
ncbi:MAG: 2-phospho-L-lactate transferase, partial [Chloroflexota bacterium]